MEEIEKENQNINAHLNDDLLFIIFSHLTISEHFIFRTVCKRWFNLMNYLLEKRKVLAISSDGKVNCATHKQITSCDAIGSLCKTVKDGSRSLYTVQGKMLKQIFDVCSNITSLSMRYSIVDRSVWEFFKDYCPQNLEEIDFSHSQGLIDEVLRFIINNCGVTLKYVKLNDSDIHESVLQLLVTSSPQLISLDLKRNYRITGQCFNQMNLNLEKLQLTNCFHIDYLGLKALTQSNCNNLKYFKLGDLPNGQLLEFFADNFANLTYFSVDLADVVVTNAQLRNIARFTQLETLKLTTPFIRYDSMFLDIFKSCPKLKKLYLDGGILTDKSLAYIGTYCPLIEELSIDNCEVVINKKLTDFTADSLAKLEHLEFLSLEWSGIGDGMCKVVEQCKAIQHIRVQNCKKITNNFILACIEAAKAKPKNEFIQVFVHGTSICLYNLNVELPENLHVEQTRMIFAL